MSTKRIHKSLEAIAKRDIPEDTNLWPQIAARLERKDTVFINPKWNLLVKVLLIVLGMFAVTAVAYIFFRKMANPGLQAVQDAGMVTNLGLTAQPSPMTTPISTPKFWGTPAVTVIAAQTIRDVSVSLDWAYADENRIAFGFTVTGLKPPPGVKAGDMIGLPNLMDVQGTAFTLSALQSNDSTNLPNSFSMTADYYTDPSIAGMTNLNLVLDIPIGGTNAPYTATDVTTSDEQTGQVTLVWVAPLGTFHFEFSLPVYKAVVIETNQTVTVNNIAIRLEQVRISASQTIIHLCFQTPDPNQSWTPEIWIQTSNSEKVFPDLTGSSNSGDEEACVDFEFQIGHAQRHTTLVISVDYLYMDFLNLSADEIESAKKKLSSMGIEIDISIEHTPSGNGGGGGAGGGWSIISKPVDMSDEEANRQVQLILGNGVPGPWVFTVDVQPLGADDR
jgi:hypothetical protein